MPIGSGKGSERRLQCASGLFFSSRAPSAVQRASSARPDGVEAKKLSEQVLQCGQDSPPDRAPGALAPVPTTSHCPLNVTCGLPVASGKGMSKKA